MELKNILTMKKGEKWQVGITSVKVYWYPLALTKNVHLTPLLLIVAECNNPVEKHQLLKL